MGLKENSYARGDFYPTSIFKVKHNLLGLSRAQKVFVSMRKIRMRLMEGREIDRLLRMSRCLKIFFVFFL